MFKFKIKYIYLNEVLECDLYIPFENVIFEEVFIDEIKLGDEITEEYLAHNIVSRTFKDIVLDKEYQKYLDTECKNGVKFNAKERLKNYKILSMIKVA